MNIIKDNVLGCGLVKFSLIRDDEDNLVFACWTEGEDPETDEPWVITRIDLDAGAVWSDRNIFNSLMQRIQKEARDADTD